MERPAEAPGSPPKRHNASRRFIRDRLSAWWFVDMSLLSRAIVRWDSTRFQGAKIGRLPGETIGHVGQDHAMINSR